MKKIKLFSAVFITTLFLVTLFSPIETYAQAARPATREVVAFREYYDCGILPPGQHQFIYKISPINSPNRLDLYAFFTIQK